MVGHADVDFMMAPSEEEITACDGKSVFEEMHVLPSTQLLPLIAVGRPKGRPSKKDGKRVNPYNFKTAVKQKPKVNTIGELFYVEKTQCKRCGQFGHASGTCQGKGYVTALADGIQANIYKERSERASAKRKAAPEPEEDDAAGKENEGDKDDDAGALLGEDDDSEEQDMSGNPNPEDEDVDGPNDNGFQDADAYVKATGLDALLKSQIASKVGDVVTCPGCSFTVSLEASHQCSFCSRVLHRFCGVALAGSEEGHGQVINCTTIDCMQLR